MSHGRDELDEGVESEAASSSNDEAFRRYVEPELPVLLRVAHRLTGNRADAEDLVQETVLRAYRAVHRFDGRYARAWLLTILRNTWRSMNRKARPSLLDEDDDPSAVRATGEGARSGEEYVVEGMLNADLVAALQNLSEVHRSLILLVDVEGLSYHEAAEFLEVPQGTIMSRLHRGRTRLRKQLERTRQHPH